jgi:hypothetical protein
VFLLRARDSDVFHTCLRQATVVFGPFSVCGSPGRAWADKEQQAAQPALKVPVLAPPGSHSPGNARSKFSTGHLSAEALFNHICFALAGRPDQRQSDSPLDDTSRLSG